MPELSPALVIGSWRMVRQEPPLSDPTREQFLHFSSDGQHYWEFPFDTLSEMRLYRLRYHMTENGFFIGPRRPSAGKGWEVRFKVEGDCLLFSHKEKRWWYRRIPAAERPDYLTCFFEPPVESREVSV